MFLLSVVLFFTPFSYYFMVSSLVARFDQKDILSLRAPKFVGLHNYLDIFAK